MKEAWAVIRDAKDSKLIILESGSNAAPDDQEQPSKAPASMNPTFRGITDSTRESQNASDPIRTNFEPVANEITDNDRQDWKEESQITSTLRRMMVNFNEQEEKHKSSIRVSRDFASNVIDSNSQSQSQKHETRIVSIGRDCDISAIQKRRSSNEINTSRNENEFQ
jgi:hypothetical protein